MTIHCPSPVDRYIAGQSRPAVSAQRGIYRDFGKRLADILLVIVAAPVVLPVVAIFALAIALGGGNPFYMQRRIGRNGRVFRMWKLRTMVPNADCKLEQYLSGNPDARKEWDTKQKLKDDPRITVLGRALRKTSLDELPQLYNVLIGDMSLVGPRPMMVGQKALYPGTAYFALRPGITGLWQVSDRNECGFANRADFDDAYYSKLSLGTDLSILGATFGVVCRGTGY